MMSSKKSSLLPQPFPSAQHSLALPNFVNSQQTTNGAWVTGFGTHTCDRIWLFDCRIRNKQMKGISPQIHRSLFRLANKKRCEGQRSVTAMEVRRPLQRPAAAAHFEAPPPPLCSILAHQIKLICPLIGSQPHVA